MTQSLFLATACFALLLVPSSAFFGGLQKARRFPTSQCMMTSSTPKTMRVSSVDGMERGGRNLGVVLASGLWVAGSGSKVANAKELTETDFITTLAYMYAAKKVLEPVGPFIDLQSYDLARTNVNYLLSFFAIQKKADTLLKGSVEFTEDIEAIDAATEFGAQLSTRVVELDTSIYTVIFIPGEGDDGKPPPAAEKYIKMTTGYLKEVNKSLDKLFALGTDEQRTKASAEGDVIIKNLKVKQPKLFKIAKEGLAIKTQDPKA